MNSAVETIVHNVRTPTADLRVLSNPGRTQPQAEGALVRASVPQGAEERLRRGLNVVIAVLLLIVCAPLMLVIALLVKLSSPGPVIYNQTRVGMDRRHPLDGGGNGRRRIDYGGRLFTIHKFRTMRADPQATLQVWARQNDARITPLGQVLRKYRLDELPQLFNVLKGEMNIVGPRPEQPNIFITLRDQVEDYARRQCVLPGITGWAQVNQSYDATVEDVRRKVKLDLEYIERRSLGEDLRILFRTVPVMLFKRGAV